MRYLEREDADCSVYRWEGTQDVEVVWRHPSKVEHTTMPHTPLWFKIAERLKIPVPKRYSVAVVKLEPGPHPAHKE